MLVKFLSFTASVIGTARYKAVFLFCLILFFSLAGIAGVAIRHDGGLPDAASTLEQSEAEDGAQQGSPQLRESRKQTIPTENTAESALDDQPSAGSTPGNTSTTPNSGNSTKPAVPADIILSTASLSLAPGDTSENISATATQDSANLAWEIIADDKLSINRQQGSGGSTIFTVQTQEDVDPSRTYQVHVRLKDTVQNTVLTSKTILVTIQ